MSQKSFEDFLKDHSSQFAPAPKASNWETIASALPPEKKKKRALWIWLSAACLVIASSVGLLLFNNSSKNIASTKTNTSTQTYTELPVITTDTASRRVTPVKKDQWIPEVFQPKKILIEGPVKTVQAAERILATQVLAGDVYPDSTIEIKTDKTYSVVVLAVNEDSILIKKDTLLKMLSKSKKEIKELQSRHLKHYFGAELATFITDTRTSVNYSNMALFNGPPTPNNPNEYKRNETDKKMLGYQFGMHYSIQRRCGIVKTGLNYQQLSYGIQVYNLNQNALSGSGGRVSNFDFNSSDSFAAGEGGVVKNTFRHLSIPLEYWRECFSLNRWHLTYGAGIRNHFLLSSKGINSQPSGYYVKTTLADRSVVQKFHMSINASIGISREFSQRYNWFILLNYARSLSELEISTVSTGYQTIGISAGIRYGLKN